jgi:hypothetical protein
MIAIAGARFLAADSARAGRTLARLLSNGELHRLCLTGGLAIETIAPSAGRPRALNDLDVLVSGVDVLTGAAYDGFLVRHFHPAAAAGKVLLQLVDPREALRIDVFRAAPGTLERSRPARFGALALRLVSGEDIAARLAAIVFDLERGACVPEKHATDLERLLAVIDCDAIEVAWNDHRKADLPATFSEARARIAAAIRFGSARLITPAYSQDVTSTCEKCEPGAAFSLADPAAVRAVLGYC